LLTKVAPLALMAGTLIGINPRAFYLTRGDSPQMANILSSGENSTPLAWVERVNKV
jgi:hypothetical protein